MAHPKIIFECTVQGSKQTLHTGDLAKARQWCEREATEPYEFAQILPRVGQVTSPPLTYTAKSRAWSGDVPAPRGRPFSLTPQQIRRCVLLRRSGLTYREIETQTGIPYATAFRAVVAFEDAATQLNPARMRQGNPVRRIAWIPGSR
jgi:hypothetical protein